VQQKQQCRAGNPKPCNNGTETTCPPAQASGREDRKRGKLPMGLVAGTNGGKQMPSTGDNTGKGYCSGTNHPYIRPIRGRRSAGLREFSACYHLLAVLEVGWVRPLIFMNANVRTRASRPQQASQKASTQLYICSCWCLQRTHFIGTAQSTTILAPKFTSNQPSSQSKTNITYLWQHVKILSQSSCPRPRHISSSFRLDDAANTTPTINPSHSHVAHYSLRATISLTISAAS